MLCQRYHFVITWVHISHTRTGVQVPCPQQITARNQPDSGPNFGLDELTLARGDGSYPKVIQRLARTWLLVLDDWGLASLSGQGRHDLLEVLDDRYARRGTLLASQVPVEHWHDVVGDPTFGDAILDRLLNNAHRITLKGASMRRLYDSTKEPHAVPSDA